MNPVKEDMQVIGVRVENTENGLKWKTFIPSFKRSLAYFLCSGLFIPHHVAHLHDAYSLRIQVTI